MVERWGLRWGEGVVGVGVEIVCMGVVLRVDGCGGGCFFLFDSGFVGKRAVDMDS